MKKGQARFIPIALTNAYSRRATHAADAKRYWEIVDERQRNRPDLRLPFHALRGERDRLWTRDTEEGAPSRSQETTRLCRLDDALWHGLQDGAFRRETRLRLITTYFTPAEQIALCTRRRLPEPSTEEVTVIRQSAEAYKASLKKGGDFRVRSNVLLGHRFTCALTGYSLNITEGEQGRSRAYPLARRKRQRRPAQWAGPDP